MSTGETIIDSSVDQRVVPYARQWISDEDIDAVCVLANGNIVLSTQDQAKIGGLRFNDGDLIEYNPVTDMSKLLFSEGFFSEDEDIDAVSILESGNILLSTKGNASLGGLRFRQNDLVEYDPSNQRATIYMSGGLFSFGDKSLDAVYVVVPEKDFEFS